MDKHRSGWRSQRNPDDAMTLIEMRLTDADAEAMHRERMALLQKAGQGIEHAFANPEEPATFKLYTEQEISAAVHWLEQEMEANPVVTPWALFSYLEGRAGVSA